MSPDLTDREVDVLRLLATGLTRGRIAVRLHLSENTVKTHCRRIFVKLGAHSLDDALLHARAAGVL